MQLYLNKILILFFLLFFSGGIFSHFLSMQVSNLITNNPVSNIENIIFNIAIAISLLITSFIVLVFVFINRKNEKQYQQQQRMKIQFEQERIKQNKAHHQALENSYKHLDEFIYIASHDLKAPLRGIEQLAQWVVEDVNANNYEEVSDNVLLMQSRAQRVNSLLNDLLMYSRVTRQECVVTDVDIKLFIHELFEFLSPNNEFILTVQDIPSSIFTFGAPLKQIIEELFINAIKHHGKTKGNIHISYTENEEYYFFTVKDDGPGIAEHHYTDIFKVFKKLTSRDSIEGSGMGLALIKKIVEHYSGNITVKSVVEQGSQFTVSWPKSCKVFNDTV